jgi:hypothetical protein
MIRSSTARATKIVALDYYDGAVGGFAEILDTAGIKDWYRFELVAWGSGQNERVFCFANAPAAGRIVSELKEPRWPLFWLPEAADSEVFDRLIEVREQASNFVAIAVSDAYMKEAFNLTPLRDGVILPVALPTYDGDDFERWKLLAIGPQ